MAATSINSKGSLHAAVSLSLFSIPMTDQQHGNPPLALLRRPEVTRRTGLSRSSLYARMKVGAFPKPVYLTPTTPAWVAAEVDGWIASLIARRDSPHSLAA